MDNDRGRMQKSIDEWREKAENEVSDGLHKDDRNDDNKSDAGGKAAKFTVKIPDDEFGPYAGPEENKIESAGEEKQGTEAEDTHGKKRTITPVWDEDEKTSEEESGEDDEKKTRRIDMQSLSSDAKSMLLSLIAGGVATALLILLEFAPALGISLPDIINWKSSPQEYVILNAALLVFIGFLFGESIVGGFVSLVTLNAGGDSLCSVAFIGALVSNVYLLWKPAMVENREVYLISAVAASCIFFNALGRYFELLRVKENLKWIDEKDILRAAVLLDKNSDSEAISNGLDCDANLIMNTRKAVFLSDYMDNAFCQTSYDSVSHVFAPVLLIAALINFVNQFFLLGNQAQAVIMFAIICCIGAPLTGALNPQYSMWRACAILRRRKAMLTGYKAVLDYSNVDAVVMDAKDIYPSGRVSLRGIKSFMGRDIDGIVLDAASLACTAGGTLTDVFMQVIGNRTDVLKNVQSYEYEDYNGLNGIVENKRVLIGTREMMVRHGINVPPRSTEAKYLSSGWDIIYIAESDKLCALLVIGYDASDRTAQSLWRLQNLDISLLLTTKDPNITSSMLAEEIDLDGHKMKVLSSREAELTRQCGSGCSAEASLAFTGGARSIASALSACVKLRGTSRALSVMQIVGAFLGIIFMMYFAMSGSSVSPIQMLAYQAIWSLPVIFLAMFRKPV